MNYERLGTALRTAAAVTAIAIASANGLHGQGLTTPTATWTGPSGFEVPFEYHRGFIVVEGSINESRPLRLIFDSGAPVMLLPSHELADSLDLNVVGQVQVAGAGDGPPTSAPLANGVRMTLGTLEMSGGNVVVGVAEQALRGLDGVIGGAVFRNAVVEIDWDDSVLRLHKTAEFDYEGPGRVFDLRVLPSGHSYVLSVPVNVGSNESYEANLHLDTGMTGALSLHLPEERIPERAIPAIIAWGSQGSQRGWYGPTRGLQLADRPLKDVTTGFTGQGPEDLGQGFESHGALGVKVLRRFNSFVDLSGGRLILEPNSHFDETFSFNTTGLRLEPWVPYTDTLVVADVMPATPAMESGIRVGDQILAIDGLPAQEWSSDDLQDVWERTAGTDIVLLVRGTDGEREVRLVTRRLF